MKVKQNLSILIWAKSSRTNKQGLIPVYARITIDGKRAEISLNKKILPEKMGQGFWSIKNKGYGSESNQSIFVTSEIRFVYSLH